MFKWAVVHSWNGQENIARFTDQTKAADYAARWHGKIIDLRFEQCQSVNSNPFLPSSTTDEEDFSQQEKTATPKLTP